jgi:hypothetical protein
MNLAAKAQQRPMIDICKIIMDTSGIYGVVYALTSRLYCAQTADSRIEEEERDVKRAIQCFFAGFGGSPNHYQC